MLKWKNEFEIGIETIDAQHKHLFEIANNAFAVLKNEFQIDKYDKIIMILEDLKQYTKYHFKSEEDYMLSINYKDYITQKAEHDNFIKIIDKVDLNHLDENPDKQLEELLTFILKWVLEHIIDKDKNITKR